MSKFTKVSLGQYINDMLHNEDTMKYSTDEVTDMFKNLLLPHRSTIDSAGYDFIAPFDFELQSNQVIKIPTGIRWLGDEGTYLALVPRSSIGFKYQVQLTNTIGIVDARYYDSDNEGHIFVKLVNRSTEGKTLKVQRGDRIVQGIIHRFEITEDDEVTAIRNGGMGSTGK